ASARGESDPLAELARLIGQTDPFGSMGRANLPLQPRSDQYDHELPPAEDGRPAGPPPWMQRAVRHEVRQEAPPPQEDYPSAVHPLHRYAVPQAAPEPDYHPVPAQPYPAQSYDAEEQYDPDPSRYDAALY